MSDLLLQIDTYAEPTPATAIEQAIAFTKAIGGELSALATHIDIRVPDNWLAEKLLHASRLAKVEEDKSLQAARAALALFEEKAAAAGARGQSIIVRCGLYAVGETFARHARTRDLSLVVVSDRNGSQRAVAEEVIFGSGRPVLVFNPDKAPLSFGSLERVALLWDGSRCAARAMADALPVLKKAKDLRVVAVIGEKPSVMSGVGVDLVRHLKANGMTAKIDEVDGGHCSIGASIDAYISESAPHLLVMGAYGRSKVREFVLGGATEHVLNDMRVPTLLSH